MYGDKAMNKQLIIITTSIITALFILLLVTALDAINESKPTAIPQAYLLKCPDTNGAARVYSPKPDGIYLWINPKPDAKPVLIGPGCKVVPEVE